jgi:hypothetical protein
MWGAAAALLMACHDDGGVQPDTIVLPANIVSTFLPGDTLAVVTPNTARVGVPFTVDIRSWGGGCTERDSTTVRVSARTAEVRPLVREPAPSREQACFTIIKQFTHTAAVTFEQAGTATVRVIGRRQDDGRAVTVTRTVTVQP